MKRFTKVEISLHSGSGAGYGGTEAHAYRSGRGVAMCRSPKSAMRIAQDAAGRALDKAEAGGFFMPTLKLGWINDKPISTGDFD